MISFVTVTELRYGALKANWGELRRRSLERDLSSLSVVQPDDELMASAQSSAPIVNAPGTRAEDP